jgi:hypothetical protein
MQAGGVIVSKGAFYGGRCLLAPEAKPAAPGFSVVLFNCYNRATALTYGAALPLNLLPRAPGIRRLRAGRIEFIRDKPHHVQADGDPVGLMPSSVIDAPETIDVATDADRQRMTTEPA